MIKCKRIKPNTNNEIKIQKNEIKIQNNGSTLSEAMRLKYTHRAMWLIALFDTYYSYTLKELNLSTWCALIYTTIKSTSCLSIIFSTNTLYWFK